MTASTEQLHQLFELVLTELDRKSIPIAYMQDIDRKGKAFIEQAGRRAPVVPQGWKLVPMEPTLEMKRAGMSERHDDLSRSVYQAMLAAAPQPPEGSMSENRITKNEVAK